jgi:flavin-dependent dehydrogenase
MRRTKLQPDVAIVGGGIAGALLARQLRMRMPDLRITVFERGGGGGSFKVGESTVEIAAHYLVRRQKLAQYLYENHLPKNGIRYFFDSAKRNTPLTEMSEIGTINLPFHAAFQLDRARLETDLCEMCRGEGIDVRIGARGHRDRARQGSQAPRAHGRDEGRQRARDRALGDRRGRTSGHARAPARAARERAAARDRLGVGPFEGLADVDRMGDESFHGRVRHTTRGLSTIHFLNPGYWVWLIRLRGGVTSVGVVGMPARDRALRTPEGFRAFLDEHRALREILADAKQIDHGSMARIAYGTKRFLGHERWALVGEGRECKRSALQPGPRLSSRSSATSSPTSSRATPTASPPTRSRSASTCTTASSSSDTRR